MQWLQESAIEASMKADQSPVPFEDGFQYHPPTMTQLTPDDVRHIAKLARLRLSEEEVTKYTTELTKILQYIDMLSKIDTKGVEPTAQVTGLENSFRDDELNADLPTRDAMLSTSPLPVVDHQIQTPSAIG